MLLLIAAALFVVGVLLIAIGKNAPVTWAERVAWVLWAVAAIIWFATLVAGHGATG